MSHARLAVVAEQFRRRVPGGIGTYAAALLAALADLEPRPDVSVVAGPPRPGAPPPDPLARFGFPVELVGAPLVDAVRHLAKMPDLPDQIVTRLWERGVGRLHGYDLVHSVSLAFPPTGATPLTVMVHDAAWRQVPDAFTARGRTWHERALQRAARSAAGIVVPSGAVGAELARSGDIDPGRLVVIPEGCDHLPPPDAPAAAELLARLGVQGDFLLAVGTLEPRKNLRRLLEAYRRLRKDLERPWPLVVVGPPGWGPALRPGAGVVLTGRVEAAVLSALYASARVVAYVPLAEGFGLPAVEALAAGAPLLVSSAVPSVVEHAGPAVIVDAHSTAEIALALGELASDDRLRRELAAAGPASVAERTWHEVARRHLAWWSDLTG